MGKEVWDPPSLPPLAPAVLNIWLALADEERHGYGIMKEAEERTGGEVRVGLGTLYGSIKRMLDQGLSRSPTSVPTRR